MQYTLEKSENMPIIDRDKLCEEINQGENYKENKNINRGDINEE